MANNPIPDQSKEFKQSGMRLITDPSSDYLMIKAREKKEIPPVDNLQSDPQGQTNPPNSVIINS